MKKVIQIENMHCQHCQMRIEKALNSIQGVNARVDLKKKQAVVTLETDGPDSQWIHAIEEAGYSVSEISERKGIFR